MTEIEFVRRWRKAYVVLEDLEHELSAGFVMRVRTSLDEVGAQARGAYTAGDVTTITSVVGVLEEIEREMLGVEASFRAEYRPRRPLQQGQDD